jgi:predicted TPR repeat methyltransferase
VRVNWRAVLEKSNPTAAKLPVTLHAAQLLILGGYRTEAAAALQELVERFPGDLQAHQQLAALLKRIARPVEAEQVLKKVALLEASNYASQAQDVQSIAEFIESSMTDSAAPQTAPASYVSSMFDQNAERFEALLRESLEYKAPELLLAACQKVSSIKLEHLRILDLGCGTGLAGEVFRPFATQLVGVDLSTKMLEIARLKSIYDALHANGILPFLQELPQQFSLILAADVFVYMGDLNAVFAAARKSLIVGGHFAFTVEASAEADYVLQAVRRYAHSKIYLERMATQHQFEIRLLEESSTRLESLRPVPSYTVILQALSSEN